METPLQPVHDLITALEADDYSKFKFGPALKLAKKALEKAPESRPFPAATVIDKVEELLVFMKEASGVKPAKSSRAPKSAAAPQGGSKEPAVEKEPGHGTGGGAGQG